MPPRNSNTKPFKHYNHIRSESPSFIKNAQTAKYIEPEKAVNNKYYLQFQKYKMEKISKGLAVTDTIEAITKSDKESDIRYVKSNWYQKR